MKKKAYTLTIEIQFSEKPQGKSLAIGDYVGRILEVRKVKKAWIATVEFRAESMIELMVMLDDRIISKELH
jgi:hypothetical protein